MIAIAQAHHVERLLRGQHRTMARPGVVGMAMGDHGALHRPDRVDVEAAGLASQTGRDGHQDVLRAHVSYITSLAPILTAMRGLDPRIHLPKESFIDGLPDIGERKRRRPLDGYVRQ